MLRLMSMMFCCLFLLSCAHTSVNPDDPEALFKEAEKAFEDEQYISAIEKYRDIKNRFPYSARALDAELRIADTFFAQESFIEAESAYEVFKELHPTHPKIDYVYYMIGVSYFKQVPSDSSRDLSAAYRAIDSFEELKKRFPSSQYIKESDELIKQSKQKLAEYENYVADFYFQRQHYLSASYRYAALLQDYPNLGYDEEALYRLAKSYYYINMNENAKVAIKQFLEKYPSSQYKDELIALLDKISGKE